MLVILDSSFLLYALKEHMEFDEEIRSAITGPLQTATLDLVRFELERLARSSTKTGGLARLALDQLANKHVRLIETLAGPREVDTAIICAALSERSPVAVATVDRILKGVLTKAGISTISPRFRRLMV